MVQISRFYRETLHGRLKERLELSENDKVLEVRPSSRNSDYFSHRGPKWAELGHHDEVGLGLAEVGLTAILMRKRKLLVWGPVGLGLLPL
jgi:hypothetical protein